MRLISLSTAGLFVALPLIACSNNDSGGTSTGGATNDANGGSAPTGGAIATGGASEPTGSTGGTITSNMGGMTNTGGTSNTSMATMTGGMANTAGMNGTPTGGTMHSGGMNATTTGGMTSPNGSSMFTLRIENTSGNSPLPTLWAPGVYAIVNGASSPFTADKRASVGLEMAAEDANPATLLSEVESDETVASSGIFNTPMGKTSAGPLMPGDAYEITFSATPGQTLHFASMFGQSNDTFSAPKEGIPLFDGSGKPMLGDITSAIALWDAGTERNEAPGMGPNQAPRQPAPNSGSTETGVSLRTDTTRAIPIPRALVDVGVALDGGRYTVTLKNKSDKGPLASPLSPAFYALHDSSYRYFTVGSAASAGLERLSEEGNSAVLVTEATSAGAVAATAGTAAYGPSASVSFDVTPTSAKSLLSVAMMIGQTNDVFVGTHPEGVPLLDNNGAPRTALEVQNDLVKSLAVWDAGTEANEAPGVGPNQAPRQPAENTGPADPVNMVRLYADSTNDFAHLSEMVSVTIAHTTGMMFQVTVANDSGTSPFPLTLSPIAWAMTGSTFAAFTLGAVASTGLEGLAEDGASTKLLEEWAATPTVASSGTAGTAPFTSGNSVTFQVTADMNHRYLNIAAMLVPSNDTFAALGPLGVALLDASGAPRSDTDIDRDLAASLAAYETGTEANQGSALGPDMAPYQTAPNTGANEGSARVRPVDGVWPFPSVSEVLKVTLTAQ